MTFREKLIELRTNAGLTQQQLSDATGMPLPSLRKYEQGARTKVPFSAVVALAKALGTDCTAFAGCEDVAAPAEEEPAPKKGKGTGKKGGAK